MQVRDDGASCRIRIERGRWAADLAKGTCERPGAPENVWSNAAYALAGFAIYFHQQGRESGLLMAMAVALALGSWAYHRYKTVHANLLDHVGMMLLFGAYLVHSWFPSDARTVVLMAMACSGFGLAFVTVYVWPKLSLDLRVGILLGLGSVGSFVNGSPGWTAAALGVYLLSYGAWQLDVAAVPGKPARLVGYWGHGLWHIGTALAIALGVIAQRGGW